VCFAAAFHALCRLPLILLLGWCHVCHANAQKKNPFELKKEAEEAKKKVCSQYGVCLCVSVRVRVVCV